MPVPGDRPDSDRPHLYVRRSGQQGQIFLFPAVSGLLFLQFCFRTFDAFAGSLLDQQYLAEKKKDLAGLGRRTAV